MIKKSEKESQLQRLKVAKADEGSRLDVFLSKCSLITSRSFAQNLIDRGLVKVEGEQTSKHYRVKMGEEIIVSIPPPEIPDTAPESIALNIAYEDVDLIVISKPAGMVVHPAPGHDSGTLVNALLFHTENLSGIGGSQRPGIIHRLDKNTSGLMIVAKNDQSHSALSRQLKKRTIKRCYLALVHGIWEVDTGTIDAPIGRGFKDRKKMAIAGKASRKALTHFRVLKRFRAYTLLEVRLDTGRTHQIRVHMAYAGHPVVGDPDYGIGRHTQGHLSQKELGIKRQFLHAYRLEFSHPRSGDELALEDELPQELQKVLETLETKESNGDILP